MGLGSKLIDHAHELCGNLAQFRTGSLLGIWEFAMWEIPKIRATFLGVPIRRIIVFWGLYWGPLIMGNYHIGIAEIMFQHSVLRTSKIWFRMMRSHFGHPQVDGLSSDNIQEDIPSRHESGYT